MSAIRPPRPAKGLRFDAEYAARLWDWIRSLEVCGDGKTVFASRGPGGTSLRGKIAAGIVSGATGSGIPVKITEVHPDSPTGSGVRVYRGDVYGDPKAAAKITAVTIQCLQIAGGEVIPVNTWAIATKANSTWTKADATTITEPVYWIQAPIWL